VRSTTEKADAEWFDQRLIRDWAARRRIGACWRPLLFGGLADRVGPMALRPRLAPGLPLSTSECSVRLTLTKTVQFIFLDNPRNEEGHGQLLVLQQKFIRRLMKSDRCAVLRAAICEKIQETFERRSLCGPSPMSMEKRPGLPERRVQQQGRRLRFLRLQGRHPRRRAPARDRFGTTSVTTCVGRRLRFRSHGS
jgi:hypothetical protein